MKPQATSLSVLLIVSVLCTLTACGGAREESAARGSDEEDALPRSRPAFGIGLEAPDFTLLDIHGREVSLLEHRGKVVVVDFWATWCAPCRIAMPHLQDISLQYPDQLAVLAISLDQDPQRVVPRFAAQLGLTFTLLADPRGIHVARQWGDVRSIPTAYLVDPQGVVVEKWVGIKGRQEYERRIRKVLGLES